MTGNAPSAAYRQILEAYKAGEHKTAFDLCRGVLKDRPNDLKMLYIGGDSARQLGWAADWVDLFERAVALDPSLIDAHYELGVGYQILGDVDQARRAFEEVLKLNDSHTAAWFRLSALASFSRDDPRVERMNALLDDPATNAGQAV